MEGSQIWKSVHSCYGNHVNNANHPDSESTLNRGPVITQIERYKTGVLKLVFGYKIWKIEIVS